MYLRIRGQQSFLSTGGRDFDPKGNVLLFLHGSGQSHLSFQLQTRFFANRGYQVLAPDLPAHGYSDGEPLESIESQADWCAALLEAAGVERTHVIAHSQGGLIALELADRHSTKVKSLSMIASSLRIAVNDALLSMAKDNEPAAIEAMVDWGHGRAGHTYDHSVPGNSHMNYAVQLMAGNQSGALYADLASCAAYTGGADAAARINCPARAVLAQHDRMTLLKLGLQMAAAIGDHNPVIITNAGHMLPSERPFDVNRAIRPQFAEVL